MSLSLILDVPFSLPSLFSLWFPLNIHLALPQIYGLHNIALHCQSKTRISWKTLTQNESFAPFSKMSYLVKKQEWGCKLIQYYTPCNHLSLQRKMQFFFKSPTNDETQNKNHHICQSHNMWSSVQTHVAVEIVSSDRIKSLNQSETGHINYLWTKIN